MSKQVKYIALEKPDLRSILALKELKLTKAENLYFFSCGYHNFSHITLNLSFEKFANGRYQIIVDLYNKDQILGTIQLENIPRDTLQNIMYFGGKEYFDAVKPYACFYYDRRNKVWLFKVFIADQVIELNVDSFVKFAEIEDVIKSGSYSKISRRKLTINDAGHEKCLIIYSYNGMYLLAYKEHPLCVLNNLMSYKTHTYKLEDIAFIAATSSILKKLFN